MAACVRICPFIRENASRNEEMDGYHRVGTRDGSRDKGISCCSLRLKGIFGFRRSAGKNI